MEPTRASVISSNFFLLFQIIVIQKEPDHPSFLIDIKSKGTFSSKKEPIGKVWYIAKNSQESGGAHILKIFYLKNIKYRKATHFSRRVVARIT